MSSPPTTESQVYGRADGEIWSSAGQNRNISASVCCRSNWSSAAGLKEGRGAGGAVSDAWIEQSAKWINKHMSDLKSTSKFYLFYTHNPISVENIGGNVFLSFQ